MTAILTVGLLSVFTFGATLEAPTEPVTAGQYLRITIDETNITDDNDDEATIIIEGTDGTDTDTISPGVTVDLSDASDKTTVWTNNPATLAAVSYDVEFTADRTGESIAADADITGLTVAAAEASTYDVSADPGSITAGNSTELTLTAEDTHGNTVTDYSGDVATTATTDQNASASKEVASETVSFSNGEGTISMDTGSTGLVTDTTDPHTLTVGGDLPNEPTVHVGVDNAAYSAEITPVKSFIESGDTLDLALVVEDEYGNYPADGDLTGETLYSSEEGAISFSIPTAYSEGEAVLEVAADNLLKDATHKLIYTATDVNSGTANVDVEPIDVIMSLTPRGPPSDSAFDATATLIRADDRTTLGDNGLVVDFTYGDSKDRYLCECLRCCRSRLYRRRN